MLCRLLTLCAVCALLPLAACGYNALEGSIDDSHALDFNRTRIAKQANELLVEYLRDTRDGVEKVCKLVVDLETLDLPTDQPYDLEGEAFMARVGLQRTTIEDNGFPEIDRGELHFDSIDFRHNGTARGTFHVFFVTVRDLEGWFDGTIEEIAPP